MFAEGIFYSCFSTFFTFEQCIDVSKIFLPSFSKPSDVPGVIFFQKSDGQRRSKEDFYLHSTCPVELLIHSVVAMVYRSSRGRACATVCRPHSPRTTSAIPASTSKYFFEHFSLTRGVDSGEWRCFVGGGVGGVKPPGGVRGGAPKFF